MRLRLRTHLVPWPDSVEPPIGEAVALRVVAHLRTAKTLRDAQGNAYAAVVADVLEAEVCRCRANRGAP